MAEPNLSDELQPRMLTQSWHRLRHAEHSAHDIMAAIPQIPQVLNPFRRTVDLSFPACFDDRLNLYRMRRVNDLKDVLARHETEACKRRLQVVDRLPHIPLSTEDQRRKPVVVILDTLCLTNLVQPTPQLLFRKPRISQYRTPALQRLDDLVARIARKGKACRRAVYLHRPSQCLLRTTGHTVRLVQNDQLMPPRR